jgi:hypothetical protein
MKVAWKIALYNLVFHQLPLIQHCSIFYKKNAFPSTKNFRRIQWQNMLRMHLLQSRISKFSGGGFGSCLWHSTLPLLYKLRLLLQFFLRTLHGSLGKGKLCIFSKSRDWQTLKKNHPINQNNQLGTIKKFHIYIVGMQSFKMGFE